MRWNHWQLLYIAVTLLFQRQRLCKKMISWSMKGNDSQNYSDHYGDVVTMPRPACTTVKTVPKKGSTALGKNQPWFIDGDLPPRQTLAPQHGRDTCTFNGAKLPPRATHSTQDGEGCLCNFVFLLSLEAKLTECYWYVAHKGSHKYSKKNSMWMLYPSQLIFFVSQKTPCHCSAIYVDAMGVV